MASIWETWRKGMGKEVSMLGTAAQIPFTGVKLPEYGISEWIQGKPATPQVQGPINYNANENLQPAPTATATIGTGGGGSFNSQSYLDLIDQDYNANLQALGNQEGELRGQAGLTNEQMQTQYGQAEQQIGGLKAKTVGALNQAATDVGTTSTSAQADARRAYQELAQRNTAQLSAAGISSSSAAEAMQEGLSTATFKALDQIINNRDITLRKVATDKANAEEYYNQQVGNLKTGLNQAQQQISLQLNAALNRISEARTTATNQKMAQRAQVIQAAQSASYGAAQTAASNQQYLDAWKASKDAFNNTLTGVLTASGNYQTINPDDVLNNLKNANKELISKGFAGIDISKSLASLTQSSATSTTLPNVYYTNRKYDANGNPIKYDQWGQPIAE